MANSVRRYNGGAAGGEGRETGRMHPVFPTVFSDIVLTQREEGGVAGRMHLDVSAYGDLFWPPGAGLRE
ncbi:hypothetical protein AGMMS49940_07750 [Spirochaetia bacterium]|nr:hypothetical protein AGMMS49940_07750 [Spirochaetia bacterium]